MHKHTTLIEDQPMAIKKVGEEESQEPQPTPPAGSESPSPSTPPTSTPPASPTEEPDNGANARYVRLLEETVREQNRQLQERATRESAPPAPREPELTPEQRRTKYFEDPIAATERLLDARLTATIKPLVEFVQEFRGGNAAEKLISQAKLNPRYSGQWDDNLDRFVRDEVSRLDPKNLNDQTINVIILSGIGLKATNSLPGQSTARPAASSPEPKREEPPVPQIPAHLRPSATSAPSADDRSRPPVRELTENERRIARENGMTPEQYLAWLSMPAEEVAFTDFGRPPKK